MRSPSSFLACLLACSALAAPAAGAQSQDLRSPDTRDAAQSRQDLRSPDARDAAQPRPVTSPAPPRSTDGDVPWALVGGGLGALLLGGVAARRRVVRLRPA